MAKRTIIFWRDIPSQVIVKQGRISVRAKLTERFMKAIDKAAMRAGRQGSKEYLDDWRRQIEPCQGDAQTIADSTARELESHYSDDALQVLVKNKGIERILDSEDREQE